MVIWPFDGSAVAWAPAIAVCPWNGTWYSASMILAAPEKAASGFPSTIGLDAEVGLAPRMYSNRFSDAGNGALAGFSHVVLSWRAARIACSSRSHTTAT